MIRREFELASAALKTCQELLRLRQGESLLITVDSAGDFEVARELGKAANAIGAKVHIAYHTTPRGYGKVGEPMLPDSLLAGIPHTDAWVELNHQWLLYSTPWERCLTVPDRVRYLFLGGLDEGQFVRCIGQVDMDAQAQFQNRLVEMTRQASHMRLTTPAGTDISFDNVPGKEIINELRADVPGAHFLLGQIGWQPEDDSICGRIVFDASFSGGGSAELGILTQPITLEIERGYIRSITGGQQAKKVAGWLEGLGDPDMFRLAHVCYGFNPGARLSGLCTEDERIWGSTEWGIGYQGPFYGTRRAVSHADGICLNTSVWMDGVLAIEEGHAVDPVLRQYEALCLR